MKNIAVVMVAVSLLFGVVGCGDGSSKAFVQDPLAEYPESVRNGLPPETRPSKPDFAAVCRDCFQILVNGEEPVAAQEAKEVKVVIEVILYKTQIPLQMKKFDLQLVNANEFPGARLILDKEIPLSDPKAITAEKKYTLSWTPEKGAVGKEVQVRKQANLRLFVDGSIKTTASRIFPIDITRAYALPEVRNVTVPMGVVKEGQLYNFTAQVFDADGTDTEPPQISVRQTLTGGGYDVSQLFRVVSVDFDAARQIFTYMLELDLRNREVTKSSGSVSFEMTALNRFQRLSLSKSFGFRLDSDVREPVSSLQTTVYEVTRGQFTTHSFTILDPGSEGDVTATISQFPVGYPGTITLNCVVTPNIQGTWMKTCELRVRTDVTAYPQTFNFKIDTFNRAPNQTPKSISSSVSIRIVEPKISTTSNPSPQPATDGGAQ